MSSQDSFNWSFSFISTIYFHLVGHYFPPCGVGEQMHLVRFGPSLSHLRPDKCAYVCFWLRPVQNVVRIIVHSVSMKGAC